MAFDFMDIIPDSPAAVKASEGARSIMENRYKQAMDAVALENALVQSAKQQISFQEEAKMNPLAKTVEAIKLVQGLNTPTINTQGLDFNDSTAMREFLQQQPVTTNLGADLMKLKAQEQAALTKAVATRSHQDQEWERREGAKQAREQSNQLNRAALEELEKIKKEFGGKAPTSERKKQQLVARFYGLQSMGNRVATQSLWSMYPKVFTDAGIGSPGAPQKASGAAPQAPAPQGTPKPPPTIVIEGRTFQKVNGKIVEVK